MGWGELRQLPIAAELLRCRWGTVVSTPDDSQPCHRQASRITVVHLDAETEVELRLCAEHCARLELETTPHT